MRTARSLIAFSSTSLLLSLITPPVFSQEKSADLERLEKSPRHHEWVEIKSRGDRVVRAFLVFPEVDRPVPGVLVIHENRGLNDWARSAADQVAEAGYVALAPDLLSGTGPDKGGTESFPSSDAAREGIYKLPPEQVLADLDACAEYLRKLDATSDAVAVSGFCWGGAQSFSYATHNPKLAAAFVFYGTPPEPEAMRKIKAPVYGFYGGNDFRVTGTVEKAREQMSKLEKTYEPVVYKEAGHGFMRAGEAPDAKEPDRKAQAEAWKRWKELLKEIEKDEADRRGDAEK